MIEPVVISTQENPMYSPQLTESISESNPELDAEHIDEKPSDDDIVPNNHTINSPQSPTKLRRFVRAGKSSILLKDFIVNHLAIVKFGILYLPKSTTQLVNQPFNAIPLPFSVIQNLKVSLKLARAATG